MDQTSRSALGLIREHKDANGNNLVIIAGHLRCLGEIEGHLHDHSDQTEARIKALEEKLAKLTGQ